MRQVAIYIHFPFCASKCRYCAFASQAAPIPEDFAEHYKRELAWWAGRLQGREVSSIYFGGGTPSLMQPREIFTLLDFIRANFSVSNDAEITMEANPSTISKRAMQEIASAGVNRLSLGVQSLDDKELRFLGRTHDAREALSSIADAQAVFENYNLDFIYGLPGQTPQKWASTLAHGALREAPHLSLYQLSIERGTPLARSGAHETDEETALAMFAMNAASFCRYEVSNYARKGRESRHNLNYWRGGDYIGTGAAAAGRVELDGRFYETSNPRTFALWAAGGAPVLKPLSRQDRAREMVMTGLRMTKGISLDEFKRNSGVDFASATKPCPFLAIQKGRAKIRKRFLPVLDSAIYEILV
jgi:oxygen-independent coproporphyrinogen-3 oxidase